MSKLTQRLQKSLSLPLGHYERKEAKEALQAEYSACWEMERKWHKQLKRKRVASFIALADWNTYWLRSLCSSLGERSYPYAVLTELPFAVGGRYTPPRKLEIAYPNPPATLMIHELAHYVCAHNNMRRGGPHGEDFLIVEDMLFNSFVELLRVCK